ncbi:galactose-1-phosphate uridylyltransferase [Actinobacillus equuli]|nr:galactose-1-phosphate uridylyltransferase [Actinobacillus equuli]
MIIITALVQIVGYTPIIKLELEQFYMSEQFILNDHPHRRFNPLKNQWILVSPHRAKRPWQGQQEETVVDDKPSYDPTCYLCPGNRRITGEQNPVYSKPFVFKTISPLYCRILLHRKQAQIRSFKFHIPKAKAV